MPTRGPVATLVLALAFTLSGCLIGKSENTQYTGRYVGEETLKQIEPGDDQAEVSLLLGEPTVRMDKSTGATVWKYAYGRATTKAGTVFLLFGSSSTVATEGAVFVEFDEGGKVVKTWSER